MRLIGTLDNEKEAMEFSLFLNRKGIEHQIEIIVERSWESHQYGTTQCLIWVYEENQTQQAIEFYERFRENHNDPLFKEVTAPLAKQGPLFTPPPPPIPPRTTTSRIDIEGAPLSVKKETIREEYRGILTRSFLTICILLFFWSQFTTPSLDLPPNFPKNTLVFASPVEKALLYDYPYTYTLLDQLVLTYGPESLVDPQELPPPGKKLLYQVNHSSFWQGFYSLLLKKNENLSSSQAPLFEKIRQGQVWRLFTPALLHADIFHIFFNMLWLIILGRQIEQHVKASRYLLFILITGIGSNTAQYLMSGPNFMGFSGILMAMLTFIWARQRHATWEGYQLDRLTVIFILLFIVGMASIQLIAFFIEITTQKPISTGIANTAHLVGALLGYLLGRMNFFRWRHS